ncbi:MAG: DoxX family protein [Mucilaginibacter sp.]
MKKINIFYWIFNGLLAALMLFSAVSSIMNPAATREMLGKHLGYPGYFAPLLNIAKILGVIAILTPGFRRLKEWAYAGFAYDLIWATYSSISVGDPAGQWGFMFVFIALFILAYIFHLKKQNATAGAAL